MARMTVKNYFSPNARQNGCEKLGITLDNLELWSVDDDGVAVLQNGILYRVSFKNRIEQLKAANVIEAATEAVNAAVQKMIDNPKSNYMPTNAGPAWFDLIGRLPEWEAMKAQVNENKSHSEALKAETEARKAREDDELLQKLLDAAADDFKNGVQIQSDLFEGLLTRHGIKAPIKTVGWLRKNLVAISQTQYKYYNSPSKSIMGLAHELAEAMAEPEPVDPEVARLFCKAGN